MVKGGFPITCLVPGPWAPTATPSLGEGWTCEWVPNDGRFGEAFAYSAVPTARRAEVEACPGAWVIEGQVDLLADAAPLLALARTLVEAGGVAVRVEQSKVGFLVGDWAELLAAGDLFRALVVVVLGADGPSTCGMHVLGLPDAASDDRVDGVRGISALCRYQILEAPLLLSGHTFAPDAATPRRTLERWPDASFPESHPCHNPFGVWRLLAASERRPSSRLPHFMPSLVSQLMAAERRLARPLDRAEVEALRDRAPCVLVAPADLRTLERSRGYVDLDPELVWEQWQLVRRVLRRPPT